MTSKPGSFTPYLEAANSRSGTPSKGVDFSDSAICSQAAVSTPAPTPLTILEILARQVQRTLTIWDLQSLSGMDGIRFRDALKSLQSLGYVAVEGESLSEVIRLTDKGAEAASLAR
jgi:uncharacterized protein YjiS (DUF1127 family)